MAHSVHMRRAGARAFTLTELLVVVALIVLLLALLLPALGGVMASGQVTKSMNNLRQISTWMAQYSQSWNDYIVPARFNYRNDAFPGRVRSNPNAPLGAPSAGTWADILHAENDVGGYPDAGKPAPAGLGNDYRYDAPDKPLYDLLGEGAITTPFRSTAPNTRNWNDRHGNEPPKPYGKGAQEQGYPGYYAANDFFRSGWVTANEDDDDRVVTNGQIRTPGRSLYLIDSYLGEIIEDRKVAYDPNYTTEDSLPEWYVDFRYAGDTALILFLDSHIENVGQWLDLDDLASRNIRICELDKRIGECSLR